jgi:hypothetical protein
MGGLAGEERGGWQTGAELIEGGFEGLTVPRGEEGVVLGEDKEAGDREAGEIAGDGGEGEVSSGQEACEA